MTVYQEKLLLFNPSSVMSGRLSFKHQENFQWQSYKTTKLILEIDHDVLFEPKPRDKCDYKYLVTVSDQVRLFSDMSAGTKCATIAIKEGLDQAIDMFNKIPADQKKNDIIDMFKYLWKKGDDGIISSLRVLSVIPWPHDIREILSLFVPHMIELPKRIENRYLLVTLKSITQDQSTNNSEIKSALITFLESTHDLYEQSGDPQLQAQLQVINTCRAQVYAMNHITRKLDDLLDKNNKHPIDLNFIKKFITDRVSKYFIYPAYAIYQARMEPVTGLDIAYGIWEQLMAKDVANRNKWALEASYTVHLQIKSVENQPQEDIQEKEDEILRNLVKLANIYPKAATNSLKEFKGELIGKIDKYSPGIWRFNNGNISEGQYFLKGREKEEGLLIDLLYYMTKPELMSTFLITSKQLVRIINIFCGFFHKIEYIKNYENIEEINAEINAFLENPSTGDMNPFIMMFTFLDDRLLEKADIKTWIETAEKNIYTRLIYLLEIKRKIDIKEAQMDRERQKQEAKEKKRKEQKEEAEKKRREKAEAIERKIPKKDAEEEKKILDKIREERENEKNDIKTSCMKLEHSIQILKGNLNQHLPKNILITVDDSQADGITLFLKPIQYDDLLILMYRESGQYKEGITYCITKRIEQPKKMDIDQKVSIINKEGIISEVDLHDNVVNNPRFIRTVEEFCTLAPSPQDAFEQLIAIFCRLKKDEKTKDKIMVFFRTDFKELLLRNFEYINIAQLIDEMVQDDDEIEEYSELFRVAESVIFEKERMAKMKLDIMRGLNIDAKYRRVVQEKKNVEVNATTLCKKCGRPVGSGWVSISPTGDIYHIPCAVGIGVPLEECEPQYLDVSYKN